MTPSGGPFTEDDLQFARRGNLDQPLGQFPLQVFNIGEVGSLLPGKPARQVAHYRNVSRFRCFSFNAKLLDEFLKNPLALSFIFPY